MTTKLLPKTPICWANKEGKKEPRIVLYELRNFLTIYGFGQFATTNNRTSSKELFYNDNGILKIHNSTTIKGWLREFFESVPEKEYKKDGVFDTTTPDQESLTKFKVLGLIQDLSPQVIESKVLNDLPIFSDINYPFAKKMNLFEDDRNTCHIRFKNGVVKITKNNIELIPLDKVKSKGSIWESSIIDKKIKITKKETGMFSEFVDKAFMRKFNKENKDWTKEFCHNDITRSQMKSFKTSYGYLIHSYNNPSNQKGIFYIDAESELGRPEGGNGKSLVMQSLRHYKKMSQQDGRRYQKNINGGGRFQFANVNVDTKFVLIDDLESGFKYEQLFSMITEKMEIEKKGKDKFTLDEERKPKFGFTTNYVLGGLGTSHTRRTHIVEFGSYWNKCSKMRELPSDKKHLGKMLFSDFTETDWNDFYNYGFQCVQQFLRDDLVQSSHNSYEYKRIKATVEGSMGTGEFTGWIEDWIKRDRIIGGYHKDKGISLDELYDKFVIENELLAPDWSKKKFDNGLWKYVDGMEGYHYNKHKSPNGDSKSARRYQITVDGKPITHIVITTNDDKEWEKKLSFKPKKKMTSKVKKTKSKTPSLNSGYEIMEEHKELISNFSEKENMKKRLNGSLDDIPKHLDRRNQ